MATAKLAISGFSYRSPYDKFDKGLKQWSHH
jgi:hypothetical protein